MYYSDFEAKEHSPFQVKTLQKLWSVFVNLIDYGVL